MKQMNKVSYMELWLQMMEWSQTCGCRKCRTWIRETQKMLKHTNIEWDGAGYEMCHYHLPQVMQNMEESK
mgnify:CR=1 FL=1